MIPAPPKVWPPIIRDADLPRNIVWRDRLLTAAMWLLLIWLCRHPLHLLLNQFLVLFGYQRHLELPDWPDRWARLRPYLEVVALFAIWLIIWAMVTLRRALRYSRMTQPLALALEEEAPRAGCTAANLTEWRKLRVCTVHLDERGAVSVIPGFNPSPV
jgi:poly-beta-1,6-N-acetyl-D-glucosamine biosynthesis protein PgaD